MNTEYTTGLTESTLFMEINKTDIELIINESGGKINSFHKGSVIASEGAPCKHLGILLAGRLEAQKTFPSGKVVTIGDIRSNDTFAEAVLYSQQSFYPSTIVAAEESVVLLLEKYSLSNAFSKHPDLMQNFINLLSNKLLAINARLRMLSMDNIRKKICFLLLEEYRKQGKPELYLKANREQMSQMLGVQRPSLSRELSIMKEEGLIDFNKNDFTILDIEAIENTLL